MIFTLNKVIMFYFPLNVSESNTFKHTVPHGLGLAPEAHAQCYFGNVTFSNLAFSTMCQNTADLKCYKCP